MSGKNKKTNLDAITKGWNGDFSLTSFHWQSNSTKNKTNYSHDKKKNIQQAALNYDVAFCFYWFDGNRNIKRQNKTNGKKMKNQWNVNRKTSKLHSKHAEKQ